MSRYGSIGDHRGVPRREPEPVLPSVGSWDCVATEIGARGWFPFSRNKRGRGREGGGRDPAPLPRRRGPARGGERRGPARGGRQRLPVPGDGEGPRSPEEAGKSRPAADSCPRSPPGRTGGITAARTGPGLRDLGEAGLWGWQRCRCPGAELQRSRFPGTPRCLSPGRCRSRSPVPDPGAPGSPGVPGPHGRSSGAAGSPRPGCPGAPHPSPGSDRTELVPGLLPPLL